MDVQAIDTVSAATAPTPGDMTAFPVSEPAAKAPQAPDVQPSDAQTLHHALSQLVGGGSKVSVQYKVVGHEIVTVFTNAETGAVITQFPSEAMVMIAQFFNQLAGAVVDRTA